MTEKPSKETVVWFGALGLLVFCTGFLRFWAAWTAADWPQTEGVVLESTIEVISDAESTSYRAHLTYRYEVGGSRYVASRIFFAQPSIHLDEWSKDFVQNNPAGSSVQVYYDPDCPWEASLFVGITPVAYAQPLAGIVCLGICLFNAVAMRKQATKAT
jgi:hypothetical protein